MTQIRSKKWEGAFASITYPLNIAVLPVNLCNLRNRWIVLFCKVADVMIELPRFPVELSSPSEEIP
jgi:hypothetical protein